MPEWRITRLRGEYAVTWDDGTVRRRYGLGTADAAEAARRAPARYAELTRPKGTTVAELWDAYVVDLDGRAVTATMTHTWKALSNRFGSMQAEKITIADCRAHTAERKKAGIKDGTIHTELGHLRMALNWAAKRKLIAAAPHIERPSKPAPKEAYLARDELGALLDAAKAPHLRLAVMLLIGTGARIGALLDLTWDRVDFERGMIRLANPFDRAKRKGRATVPMNGELRAALDAAKKGALTLFVVEWAGAPIKSIKKGLKAAGTAIGRPDVSPHMLRHSAAVRLAEDGFSMSEIAAYLGHRNSRVTEEIYARFSPTHLRKLADALEMRSALQVQ